MLCGPNLVGIRWWGRAVWPPSMVVALECQRAFKACLELNRRILASDATKFTKL